MLTKAKYLELIQQFPPRPIHSEQELEAVFFPRNSVNIGDENR